MHKLIFSFSHFFVLMVDSAEYEVLLFFITSKIFVLNADIGIDLHTDFKNVLT